MNTSCRTLLSVFLFFGLINAQYDASVEEKTSHLNWGTAWGNVFVAGNNIVTLAVVPNLGGRVMQYDMGDHSAIYVAEDQIGSIPADGNALVGGFRMLPSPQSDFVWPSPPEVDFNPYSCEIKVDNTDSSVIYLESEVVTDPDSKYATHQGMQFKRELTLYKASTRVKVEMTMLNKGSNPMQHGIWDITQTDCSNNGTADIENMWVYFKRNPSGIMATGYIEYPDQADQNAIGEEKAQWKPEAAEGGVMGVQFLQKQGKIGADCSAGWICHVDRLDGYAYVKTFTYEDGKTYPDGGASVQVYTYSNAPTVEVEVLGPLTDLAPNDSVKMIENWYMARSHGPVLEVNDAGLITKKLTAEENGTTLRIDGTFGVFHPGTVKAELHNATDEVVAVVDSVAITPQDSLRYEKDITLETNAASLQLVLYSTAGERIGLLDSVEGLPTVATASKNRAGIRGNPVSYAVSNGTLRVNSNGSNPFTLEVFSLSGKRIASLSGKAGRDYSIPLESIGTTICIIEVSANGKTFNSIMSHFIR
jgi:hypothetical protein